MKQYQKVKVAMGLQATPSARHNKLIKLASESTDEVLKELLLRVAKMYSYHLGGGQVRHVKPEHSLYGYVPTNHHEWASAQSAVNKELHQYLDIRIAEGKPEWMVMAEKYGWTPPRH